MPVDPFECGREQSTTLLVERVCAAAQLCNRLGQVGALAVEGFDLGTDLGRLAFGHQIDRSDAGALAVEAIEPFGACDSLGRALALTETGERLQFRRPRPEAFGNLTRKSGHRFLGARRLHLKSRPALARFSQSLIAEARALGCLPQPAFPGRQPIGCLTR